MARNRADAVLVVGARLGEYDAWGMPPVWGAPAGQQTIQIDSDPMSIGLNRPVDIGIVADAKAALGALLKAVKAKRAARAAVAGLDDYRAQTAKTMEQGIAYLGNAGTTGVNPGMMVLAVREAFPPEAITVLDGGNTTLIGVAYHPILSSPSFLYSVKMGYLGTGVPFAIGAKLAAPGRPVCLISGDGALGFNLMEMETAARESLPVIVVAAVDDAWGMEKTAFKAMGYGADDWAGRGIEMAPIRYDGIAEKLGCHGEYVETYEDLGPALQRAIASGRPALIHVKVDKELNTVPPGWEQFRSARNVRGY
jgi:acetolactate synthase-1/2/3 large subunit